MNALADVVDVAALVFERLPLRDRVRCLGVCRAWRAILLDAQHALFASLSLARTSGGALSACGALWAPLTRDLSLDRFRGWRRRRRQRALPSAADDDDDDESDVDAAALDVRALCGLRALRTLVLTSGRGLTSAVVRRVLRALPALASLDLSFSAGIDDALFDGGGALSTSLRELRMRHLVLVSVPLVRVLQALPSLALLDAAHCVQLDRTARDTDDAATRAQAWPALHTLCLAHTSLQDTTLAAVCARAPALTAVDVGGCPCIAGAGVRAIAQHCGARLRTLSLSDSTGVGASDVEAVLRACTSLAWLGLAQLPVPEGALVAALRAGVLRTLVVPGARTVYETQVALSPNSASAAAVAAARAAMDAPANADAALEVLRDASGALQVPPLDVLYVSPAHSTFRDALLSRGSIPAHECVEFSVWDAVFDDNADVLEEAGARARLVFNNVPRERYGAHESAAKRNAVMDLGDAAMVASFEGRGAVLAALLVHGAPCDTIVCGEQAIHAACRGPRERDAQRAHCVKLLLAAGVNVNARTAKVSGFFTPLMLAAWKESDAVLRVLLDNKADVDSLSSENRKSALDFAARYDCEACVRMLCAAGAAVNGVRGQNAESPLPLELAAWKGKRGTVSALLDAGAKTVVSGRPSEQTVLHIALRLNPDVASLLICPETVNVPMAEGVTPLHLAVHARSESLVRQLLSAGANCYALTTKHGAAPIHMAVRMHEVGIVRLFLAHDRGLLQAATATGESTLALVARITDPAVSAVVAEFVPSNIGRQLLAGSAAVRAAGEHAPPGESGAAPARPGDALTPPIAAGRRGSAVSSSASALSLPGATSAPSSSSSLPGVVVAPGMVAAAAASVNGTRAAAVVAAASAQASATAAAAASAASHARPTRSAIERALSRAVSSTDELLRIPRAAVMAKAQRAPQFPYAQLLGHMQGAGGNAGGRRAPRPTSLPRSAGAVHAAPAEHVRTRGVSQRAR